MEFFIDTEMPRTARVTGITICFALVACGPRTTSTPQHVDPPKLVDAGVVVEPVPLDAAAPVTLITPSQPKTRIESPHGGAITDLAVTSDGTAAITSDDLGGHRLWPTLDGQLEPRVTELPAPSQLAIARDPKGFLIALIDEAGGLVLQLVDRDGLLLQRASLGIEPPWKGLAMTDRGPLAWRADQRIVRLTAAGAVIAHLASEPGQRVLHVAVPAIPGADRAIAVIEGSTDTTTWRRARFLIIGDKLAWGAWIPAGDETGTNLAVSPDLKRFAYVRTPKPGASQIVTFDVATGKEVGTETAFNVTAIEMPDADHVVYSAANGQTMWTDVGASTTKRNRPVILNQPTTPGVLASGGGKTFNANGSEIAISSAQSSQYLGYGLQASQVVAAGDAGQLAITWGDRVALLNDHLTAQQLPLVPANHTVNGLRWLTGGEWLVQAVKLDNATTTLTIVDVDQHQRTDVRTNQPAGQLTYDPSSKLVGVSFGVNPEVYRHLPGKLRLESVASFPKPPPYDRVGIYPVSPQLAGGTQVVVSHVKDTASVRWVPDARALDKGVAMTIEGAVAAVDATGKVYAWINDGKGTLELAMLRDGKRLGALAVERGSRGVWPDAKGERVLVTHNTGLTMYDADGKSVWTRPIAGITHAVWLSDGAIAAVTGQGVVRLAAPTGATTAMRCGWLFELSTTPHAPRSRVEPMCTKRP